MPVYFIRAGETGPVKIGWANEAEIRRRKLQTAHHEPLHIIRIIDGIPRLEQWLHERFEAARLLGEWFLFDADMLSIEPPDLTNWKPTRRERRRRPDPLGEVRADFAAYLDSGSPVLARRLAAWMTMTRSRRAAAGAAVAERQR